MKITEDFNVYECDKCHKQFMGYETEQTNLTDHTGIIDLCGRSLDFVFVNSNDVIVGKNSIPSEKAGDKVLACPHCKNVQLFGFNLIKSGGE